MCSDPQRTRAAFDRVIWNVCRILLPAKVIRCACERRVSVCCVYAAKPSHFRYIVEYSVEEDREHFWTVVLMYFVISRHRWSSCCVWVCVCRWCECLCVCVCVRACVCACVRTPCHPFVSHIASFIVAMVLNHLPCIGSVVTHYLVIASPPSYLLLAPLSNSLQLSAIYLSANNPIYCLTTV